MASKLSQQAPALFLPEFLGHSALNLGASALFFDQIGFDVPVFLQPEVVGHFNEVGAFLNNAKSSVVPAFVMAAQLFRAAQQDAQKALELLKPLFESKLFLQVGMVHFIMRSGREWLRSGTQAILDPGDTRLQDRAILHIAARELIWHVHETYLEFDGDVQRLVEYVEEDAKRYQNPLEYLASFVCHRLAVLEGNPGPVLTSNPLMLEALAAIGKTTMPEKLRDARNMNVEYLSFALFDSVVRPFAPRLHQEIPERLAGLKTRRHKELNALRKHVRDIASELLIRSCRENPKQSEIQERVNSLQEAVREAVEFDQRTMKRYFQALLEDKSIWIGLVGLVAGLVSGISPVIPAGFGVTALATAGAEAVKAIREKKESLNGSPTSFLYYLDRCIGTR